MPDVRRTVCVPAAVVYKSLIPAFPTFVDFRSVEGDDDVTGLTRRCLDSLSSAHTLREGGYISSRLPPNGGAYTVKKPL